MIIYELLYLISPIAISRNYREAILGIALLSVSRSLYIASLYIAYGIYYDGQAGYFRGLSLIASVFLLFYFGPPEESSIVYALISAYIAIFPPLVPIVASISGFIVRYIEKKTSKELKNEVLMHSLLTGFPVIMALSYLSIRSLIAEILASLVISYRLLLLAPVEDRAFLITRGLLSLSLSLTILYSVDHTPIIIIGVSFVRPSLIGSELIRLYTMKGENAYMLLSIASYFLTLLTLYGEPIEYFSAGIVLTLILLVATIALQEVIRES